VYYFNAIVLMLELTYGTKHRNPSRLLQRQKVPGAFYWLNHLIKASKVLRSDGFTGAVLYACFRFGVLAWSMKASMSWRLYGFRDVAFRLCVKYTAVGWVSCAA
jgi:hypothetical protein